jgi:hypothetical protein
MRIDFKEWFLNEVKYGERQQLKVRKDAGRFKSVVVRNYNSWPVDLGVDDTIDTEDEAQRHAAYKCIIDDEPIIEKITAAYKAIGVRKNVAVPILIVYSKPFQKNPSDPAKSLRYRASGDYNQTHSGRNRSYIRIYRSIEDANFPTATLLHEIAHAIHFAMLANDDYKALNYMVQGEESFPSLYSTKEPGEWLAEVASWWMFNPTMIKKDPEIANVVKRLRAVFANVTTASQQKNIAYQKVTYAASKNKPEWMSEEDMEAMLYAKTYNPEWWGYLKKKYYEPLLKANLSPEQRSELLDDFHIELKLLRQNNTWKPHIPKVPYEPQRYTAHGWDYLRPEDKPELTNPNLDL